VEKVAKYRQADPKHHKEGAGNSKKYKLTFHFGIIA